MKVIFKRTLQETLKIFTVIAVVVAGFIAGYILAKASFSQSVPAYTHWLNKLLISQHLAVFFVVNGVVLLTIVSSVSSGLIAGEVHEGTFKILVAKPNSRIAILLGKILGMWAGVMILMFLSLSVMFLTELMMGNIDGNIANDLLRYFPAYVLYGIIVSFFLSSFGVLLSTIAKKRIIALLPCLLIVIGALALPIILRITIMIARGGESPWILNLIDLNYHFSLIFNWCCDLFGGIKGTTNQLEPLTLLMNLFNSVRVDMDLTRTNVYQSMTLMNKAIPQLAILLVYVILGVINYLASLLIINNKNV